MLVKYCYLFIKFLRICQDKKRNLDKGVSIFLHNGQNVLKLIQEISQNPGTGCFISVAHHQIAARDVEGLSETNASCTTFVVF